MEQATPKHFLGWISCMNKCDDLSFSQSDRHRSEVRHEKIQISSIGMFHVNTVDLGKCWMNRMNSDILIDIDRQDDISMTFCRCYSCSKKKTREKHRSHISCVFDDTHRLHSDSRVNHRTWLISYVFQCYELICVTTSRKRFVFIFSIWSIMYRCCCFPLFIIEFDRWFHRSLEVLLQ
jgi:hypothetical protein